MLQTVRKKWLRLTVIAAAVAMALYWNAARPPAPTVNPTTLAEAAPPTLAPPLTLAPDEPPPTLESVKASGRWSLQTRPWNSQDCTDARFSLPAVENARSLHDLNWSPFGRVERGWEIYAPLIATEIDTRCAPPTPGFASALSRWQAARGLTATGRLDPETFLAMKRVWQQKRPFARRRGSCPPPPNAATLAGARAGEGYGGKHAQLLPGAFEAYRRMARDARAQVPAIGAEPRYLQIFSAYRSPSHDAARCARDGNCNGIVRARCSPHRTGAAMDLYVGQAPGYRPDSTADPNRLAMSKSPAYLWLVDNAHKYGFVPYAFEPWHWEWIGDPSSSNQG